MRWGIFIGLAFIFITLEASLLSIFEIKLPSLGGIRPSLTAILALYVALWAPRMTALWACFILGLLVDLTSPTVLVDVERIHPRVTIEHRGHKDKVSLLFVSLDTSALPLEWAKLYRRLDHREMMVSSS